MNSFIEFRFYWEDDFGRNAADDERLFNNVTHIEIGVDHQMASCCHSTKFIDIRREDIEMGAVFVAP